MALSRCKTFEGMVLSSPIPPQGIETDDAVLDFVETARQAPPSDDLLQTAKISFQQKLLMECFDFQLLHNRLNYLARLLLGNTNLVQVSGITDMDRLQETAGKNIFTVSEKFKQQLRTLFENNGLPESDNYILERTGKASAWFQEQFSLIFDDLLQKFQVETDNKELGKKLSNALNNLKQEIVVNRAGIHSCENGFSPSRYLRSISKAELDFTPEKTKKSSAPAYSASDIEHPELFQQLKDWRSRTAKEQGLAHFQVLHQRVLIQIVVSLPDNTADLKKISGVGKKTLEKYGKEILEQVVAYRKDHGIEKVILPPPKDVPGEKTSPQKPTGPSNTMQTSFDMFNKGMAIADIAEERGLVENTIQGHLCYFIENDQLDINKVLSPEKQSAIKAALAKISSDSIKAVKKELGDDFSYGDIKLMMAHQKHLISKKN